MKARRRMKTDRKIDSDDSGEVDEEEDGGNEYSKE